MTKLLVTGGAGFIGSEFVRQGVQRGYQVIVIDNLSYAGDSERLKEVDGKFAFYKIDIADRESLEEIFQRENPDTVVHWAAESHVDRSILDASPFLDTNIKGTHMLLDVSIKHEIKKFINVSTDEVYGDLKENGQFYEITPLNPNSPYSVSKASADMLGRAYNRTYGLPVITVRPSNNYGHWQYPEKFIPIVILKAVNDEKIPVYAKGENVREWLHVSDCADGVFSVLENGETGETYNIGSGEEKRNIDVAQTILKQLGKSNDLIEFIQDRLGHDFRYSLNSDKIKTQIGWTSKIPFSSGIEETIKWYVDNMEWIKSKVVYLKEYWKKVYKKP